MSSNARADDRIRGSLRSGETNGVAVRIEHRLDTEIDHVWAALTEPGRLARWYGELDGELRPGGEFRARLFASGWEGTGRVEACEPARRLLVVSKDPELPNEDSIEVTLTTHGGQTVLAVEQWGIPLDMLPAYAAGLQIHVEDLADYLDGRERREASKARWDELIPAYQRLAADL
jgi:uncharacterized protein YndB with AHSA1/START domain